MKLVDLQTFLDDAFAPVSRPSERTALTWCSSGKLPARRIGHKWYVDVDAWTMQTPDAQVAADVARILGPRRARRSGH